MMRELDYDQQLRMLELVALTGIFLTGSLFACAIVVWMAFHEMIDFGMAIFLCAAFLAAGCAGTKSLWPGEHGRK